MHSITSIISILSAEEKRDFISLLKQKNKRADTKNIELFKLLNATPEHKNLDVLIYKKKAKGAYHALCKRLHDSLIDFIATKRFERESSEEMEVMKLLIASRVFFEQKQYKIALKTIRKAELKAKIYDLYSILREIYYTRIQYAHQDIKTDLEDIIKDFRHNQKLLSQEENLNLFYATIQDHLTISTKNIPQIIQDTLSRFDISISHDISFRSLYKILEIGNRAANIERNFHVILPFVEKAYQQIEAREALVKKHLFYHIQILYYVSNSYFRTKDFTTSMKYLKLMKAQMQEERKKYDKRFLPQYTLLKVLNHNYSGNANLAMEILEKFDHSKSKHQTSYLLDLKLSRIVVYFQQSRPEEAIRLYRDLYHSDIWYTEKAGTIWVIKKNLIEILLYIELNNVDLVISRVKSFRKKYGNHLKNTHNTRVLDFLSLATTYYYHKENIDTSTFLSKIENTLIKNIPEHEDIFTMSFYAWLKAKVTQSDIYKVTLKTINRTIH